MAGIVKSIKAAFGDVEMTPYTVVAEKNGYEERLYPARKWACTSMGGVTQQELVSPMFRALFNYISGKNEPNVRVDMTSPVTTYVEPGDDPQAKSTFTMGFLVPEEHQPSPPSPVDKTIFIENRPELTILTRQFGGYANEQVLAKERTELSAAIKKNGETGVNFDQYYIVGYDPPFKLFGRRNEIWFVKTKTEEEQKAALIEEVKVTEEKEESEKSASVNGEVEAVKENGEGQQ